MIHLFRDILDQQIVDRDDKKMGRADGIVVRLGDGGPPRVESLELGFATIAKRLHPAAETMVESLHRRFSVRRSLRYHIKWSDVTDHDMHCIKVDLKADETPATDWERWLRKHVVGKIPGADMEHDEK